MYDIFIVILITFINTALYATGNSVCKYYILLEEETKKKQQKKSNYNQLMSNNFV